MASSGKGMVCVGRWARCASVAVVGVFVSWVSLGVGDASAATMTFNSPSSNLIVVPAGVTSMTATVIGAAGGACGAVKGGLGASLTATVPVTPAEQLFVGVGSAGTACSAAGGSGGIGGGGDGGSKLFGLAGAAGGGGGSLIAAVGVGFPGFGNGALVAAGGGGGAGAGKCTVGTNAGGNADSPGGNGPHNESGGPGGAGGATGGGEGGVVPSDTSTGGPATAGDPGSFNVGGDGGTAGYGGGGGGGGLWGGGGGGPGFLGACGAGGGGGGSFAEASATAVKGPAATASVPQVVITFAAAGLTLSAPNSELLKCKTDRGTQVCRRASGEVPPGSGASQSAKISRGHKVYATGASVPTGHGTSELVLAGDRRLKPGHYTLTLSRRHGHHKITRKLALTLA